MVNSAAMDIPEQMCKDSFSVLLGVYLGVELLGHMIIVSLMFKGTIQLFSTIFSSHCHVQRLQFLHIPTKACYFSFYLLF
jgi:hypothetical protein